MSIGSRIKELRLNIGLTQESLSKLIGVTKGSIANYENEVSVPKIEILFKLLETLKCDANYLYQDDMVVKPMEFTTTLKEQNIITKYRSLTPHGKGIVENVLNYECDYQDTTASQSNDEPEKYIRSNFRDQYHLDPVDEQLITKYMELSSEQKKKVKYYFNESFKNLNLTDEEEIELEVASYKEELRAEKHMRASEASLNIDTKKIG